MRRRFWLFVFDVAESAEWCTRRFLHTLQRFADWAALKHNDAANEQFAPPDDKEMPF
jgi:hypothetical protein